MPLPPRVGDEEIRTAVAGEVRSRDSHSRIRVGNARDGRALLEAEAETGRIRFLPSGPGDVLVEPVWIPVVGEVEIGPAVAVEIREDGAETVIEPCRLETCLDADLAKPRVALAVAPDVQVEEIADAGHVVREPGGRPADGEVGVGVARHEQVGAPVAVDVGDRRAGVPSVDTDARGASPFGERSVAVVPEQLVVSVSRRHEQVGVAVSVEVAGDAAFSPDRQVRVRTTAHVREATLRVPEQRAPRETAVFLPARVVRFRVRVHDEEVDPAVVVVVERA